MICSVHAGNIGRNVYSVYSESLTGSNFDDNLYMEDSVRMWRDHGMRVITMTLDGVEGWEYTRCIFSEDGYCWVSLAFADSPATSTNTQATRDMSAYYGGTLKFLIRVNAPSTTVVSWDKLFVGLTMNGISFRIPLTKIQGFDTGKIGYWQEVSVALNEDVNFNISLENLKKTTSLFTVLSNSGITDRNLSLDFDCVRWVKPGATGDYSVKLKKLSDGSVVSTNNITWSSSKFQQGWQVADQFLEIDYDVDSSTRNWSVKLYTNNGDKLKNGLYANKDGKDYVMTMCWRASENALPYTDYNGNHTLQIAQGHNSDGDYDYLYDRGSGNTNYAPWLYMQDYAKLSATDATDKDRDYSTVIGHKKGGSSGYHGYSGEYNFYSKDGYYPGSKVNLYLGANCDVGGGLRYTGNIVVALEYE